MQKMILTRWKGLKISQTPQSYNKIISNSIIKGKYRRKHKKKRLNWKTSPFPYNSNIHLRHQHQSVSYYLNKKTWKFKPITSFPTTNNLFPYKKPLSTSPVATTWLRRNARWTCVNQKSSTPAVTSVLPKLP